MHKDIGKPVNKWRRRDFQPIIRGREDLQELTLPELRALFLIPDCAGDLYFRIDIPQARNDRKLGAEPQYHLAIPERVATGDEMEDHRAAVAEANMLVKLYTLWRNL